MAVITLPNTLSDGTIPTAAQFNANFNTIYNEFNGNIDNANIKAAAAIAESKLAFDTSAGHDHDGANSKKITVNRGFPWFLDGTLFVSASRLYVRFIVPQAMTIVKAWARVEDAPDGADILVDIHKNGTSIWNVTPANRLTVADGATTGTTTSFDTTSLAAGDYLDIFIDQIGSTDAGGDLAVMLECEQ